MAYYSIEQKIIGIGKENVRGQSVNPTKYIPVYADSWIDYKQNLIEDELVRGIFEKFSPQSGIREANGTITIDVESENIGEFLYSLLGSVESQDVGNNGRAYKHIFKRINDINLPSYTIYIGMGNLAKKRYPLCVVKSITFTGSGDGKLTAGINVIAKTEEDTNLELSPNWVNPTPFMFYQTKIKIDNVEVYNVKDWGLTIDNQAVGIRTLIGSKDIQDILAVGKLLLNGNMTIYFQDLEQRNKFLNNDAAKIEIILTGSEIETGYNHELKFIIPRVHYTAYSFNNVDGLIGSAVSFNGYFSVNNNYGLLIELTNTINGY